METREETFLNMALEYKKEYENTAWWKFCKRSELKKNWYVARYCAVRERWADEGQICINREESIEQIMKRMR